VHDELLHRLAVSHGLQTRIEVCPPIGYREALIEMLRADGLLVLQGASCNEQVPAKIYEYLRARRPIVCLSDPRGDTATVLSQAGCGLFAPLDNSHAIGELILRVLNGDSADGMPHERAIATASRLSRAEALARHFDRIIQTERKNMGALAAPPPLAEPSK
jgi:hypothetical protein